MTGRGKNRMSSSEVVEMEPPLCSSRSRARETNTVAVIDLRKYNRKDYGSEEERKMRMREDNKDGSMEHTTVTINGTQYRCLWCTLCKSPVSGNKTKFFRHLKTDRHKDRIEGRVDAEVQKMAKSFHEWRTGKGKAMGGNSNVDDETDNFRFQCVYMLMQSGIPFEKLEHMRKGLERISGKYKLTDVSSLKKVYIPAVLWALKQEVIDALKEAIESKVGLLVIFDGSTRIDNHLCIVVRMVTDKMKIRQYVISLHKYADLRTADQLVTAINRIIVSEYQIAYSYDCSAVETKVGYGPVIGFQGDSCSVNESAKKTLTSDKFFEASEVLHCFSHYYVHIGEKGQ